MTPEMVSAVLDGLQEQYENSWEQARFIAYVQAASAGVKINKPSDLIKFSWETEEEIQPKDLLALQYELIAISNSTEKTAFIP
jgi:hypothetical protein